MELHSVTKKLVEKYGADIIKDKKLVSMLSDYQVFELCPSARYMLRSLIEDGYSAKLLSCGAWNNQAIALLSNYSDLTGFQPNVLTYVFRSIAYSLSWVQESPVFDPNCIAITSNSIELSKNEVEDKLLDLVVINPLITSKYGIEITNYSFSVEDDDRLTINLEVSGLLTNAKAIGIYFALYDNKKRVRFSSILQCIDSSYDGFKVSMSIYNIGMNVCDITKVFIYPEKLD